MEKKYLPSGLQTIPTKFTPVGVIRTLDQETRRGRFPSLADFAKTIEIPNDPRQNLDVLYHGENWLLDRDSVRDLQFNLIDPEEGVWKVTVPQAYEGARKAEVAWRGQQKKIAADQYIELAKRIHQRIVDLVTTHGEGPWDGDIVVGYDDRNFLQESYPILTYSNLGIDDLKKLWGFFIDCAKGKYGWNRSAFLFTNEFFNPDSNEKE